jgi:hypothetical protein
VQDCGQVGSGTVHVESLNVPELSMGERTHGGSGTWCRTVGISSCGPPLPVPGLEPAPAPLLLVSQH